MSSKEILDELTRLNIAYQLVNHPPVYTAEEADRYTADYDFARAKKPDKHLLYLVSLVDDKRLDMKSLRRMTNTGRLSFATAEQLTEVLGVGNGAVSPLNLINDHYYQVKVIFDSDLVGANDLIGCHPNDNSKTVILRIDDLLKLIHLWGNSVSIMKL